MLLALDRKSSRGASGGQEMRLLWAGKLWLCSIDSTQLETVLECLAVMVAQLVRIRTSRCHPFLNPIQSGDCLSSILLEDYRLVLRRLD